MKEIIDADEPIVNVSVSRKDAYEYSENNDEYEKCLNYTYLTNESVTMYELMDTYNYFYYIMPASTGILKNPAIWAACKSVHTTLLAPATVSKSATNLAEIGWRALAFLSCLL